jgi:hypothetical protein
MSTDTLEILAEIADDAPPLGDDARAAARARLLDLTRPAPPPPARPRRRWRRLPRRELPAIATVGAIVLVALVAALTAGEKDRGPLPRLQPAAANPILVRAAERVAAQPAPTPPRGDQYLYVRQELHETPVGGGPEQVFVDEGWTSVDGSGPTRSSERGRSWLSYGEVWPPTRYEDLAALPTEPAQLRAALAHGTAGPAPSSPTDRETEITGLLFLMRGYRVMPPDLRAAIFRALAELPEVHVERARDALGRPGFAIGATGAHMPEEAIVDRRTYEPLGFRGTLVREDGVTVRQLSAITRTAVVDELDERPPR